MFKGKKTIIAGVVMIVFAATSYLIGDVTLNVAIQRGIEGAAIIFLRLGIGNGA